jgi:hypothetical protein
MTSKVGRAGSSPSARRQWVAGCGWRVEAWNCGRTGVPVVVTRRVCRRAAASANPTNAPSTSHESQRLARPGDGIRFVQESLRPEAAAREHGRRAGETAHRQHRARRLAPERDRGTGDTSASSRRRTPGKFRPVNPTARQRYHLELWPRRFAALAHGGLIHLLGRDEQRDREAAPAQLITDRQAGEQMAARASTGNGDVGKRGAHRNQAMTKAEGRNQTKAESRKQKAEMRAAEARSPDFPRRPSSCVRSRTGRSRIGGCALRHSSFGIRHFHRRRWPRRTGRGRARL